MDYEYYDDYVYYDYDVVPSTPKRIDRPRRRQYGGIKSNYFLAKKNCYCGLFFDFHKIGIKKVRTLVLTAIDGLMIFT